MTEIKNEQKLMIAPCGINCTYCYVHHKKTKPCPGCRQTGTGKPERCTKCKIKECSNGRSFFFCGDCPDYPCCLIKRLDKSYAVRYNESIVNNMTVMNERGIDNFLKIEEERLKCPECSGFLNIHDKRCSECGKTFKVRGTNQI